jgi:aspartate/methionine/tyrosine aminotransferase
VALAALGIGRGYCGQYLTELDVMRRLMFDALHDPSVPCDVSPCQGAFYYFIRVHTTLDPMTLTERLIREHRVAVIPGSAFGMTSGCHARISFGALDRTRARDGIDRLCTGLKALVSHRSHV